ncbi:hypothetical protein DYY67_0340 [Candidatus Nitrosotalea sp. TS]|nr:hypothetical protein [Candidatus Nitrosotalea sp. TS]
MVQLPAGYSIPGKRGLVVSWSKKSWRGAFGRNPLQCEGRLPAKRLTKRHCSNAKKDRLGKPSA